MDKRLKKINIKFPKNWKDISVHFQDGPPTFVDVTVKRSGVIQISMVNTLSEKFPNPTLEELVNLSRKVGQRYELGEVQNKTSGKCRYGTFGSAQFSNAEFPHSSVWHISNGKDFILATFISPIDPPQKQLEEVNKILTTIKKRSPVMSLFG